MFNRGKLSFKTLNNNECASLLNETQHRTDFLTPLKNDITVFIEKRIHSGVIGGNNHIDMAYSNDNDYFDVMYIRVYLVTSEQYKTITGNGGEFYNEEKLENGKIKECYLDIQIKISPEGQIYRPILEQIVDHEINHMYDDWEWIVLGHEPLSLTKKINISAKFIEDNINSNDGLLKAIAWCLYLSKWTEENAHVNQAYSEFQKVKLTRRNVHWKLKSTNAYRNYNKAKIDMEYYVGNTSENTLKNTYNSITSQYGNIGLPVPTKENKYGEKLLMWAENIFNHFLKRYCSEASLYLDRLTTTK